MDVSNTDKDFLRYIIKTYNDNNRINHIITHVLDEIIEPVEHTITGSVQKNPTRSMPNPLYQYELEPTGYGYILFPLSRTILHPEKLKSSLCGIINENHLTLHIKKPETFQDLNFQDDPCPDCYTLLFSAEMADEAPTDGESLKQLENELQSAIAETMRPPCIVGNVPVVSVCRIFTVEKKYVYNIAWVNNQKSLKYLEMLIVTTDTAKNILEQIEKIEEVYNKEKINRDIIETDYNNAFVKDKEQKIKDLHEAERKLKIVALDCREVMETLLKDYYWHDILDSFALLISNKKGSSLSHICQSHPYYMDKTQITRLRNGERKPNFKDSIILIFALKVSIITAETWLKKRRFCLSDSEYDKHLWKQIENRKYKIGCDEMEEFIG